MLPRCYSFLSSASVSVSLPFLWCDDGRGCPDLSVSSPEKVLGIVVGPNLSRFRDFQVRPHRRTAAASLAALLQLSFMQCLSWGGGDKAEARCLQRKALSVAVFALKIPPRF